MARHLHKQASKSQQQEQPSAWWAAVIDEKGNEVRITEGMIHQACEDLARNWTFPRMTDRHTVEC